MSESIQFSILFDYFLYFFKQKIYWIQNLNTIIEFWTINSQVLLAFTEVQKAKREKNRFESLVAPLKGEETEVAILVSHYNDMYNMYNNMYNTYWIVVDGYHGSDQHDHQYY